MLNKIKKLLGTGNIMVTGPPGSGKTQALIGLINYLVGDGGVAPHRVLVFCFNRKWAKIIREETALAAPKSQAEIPINTFHSFCLDFLERYRSRILLEHLQDSTRPQEFNTDINLLNSTQQWALLSEVMSGLDKKNYAISINYLNKNKFIANSYTQEVFDFILRAQESLLEPRKILDKFNPYYSKALSEIGGIYLKYLNELNSRNAYNYGLLLQHTAEILQKEEEVREEYRQKYDYIIFEELQESNPAQLTIADLISGENCIFFGNDDQAVFSFRGSMSQNFRRVYDRTGKKNIITGKRNYRNSRDINKLSQHFIALNSDRLDKKSISGGGRGKVWIKDFHHMLDEAQFICEKIKGLKNKKIPLEQVAVIIKGLGYETHIIENALDQNGIPFSRRGSRTILDNATVRYLLNVLRLFGRPYRQTEELDYLVENILLSSVLDINPLYFKEIKKRYQSHKQEYEHIIDFLREDKNYEKKEKINQFLACLNKFEGLQQVPVFDFLLELIQDQYLGLWGKTSLDWEPGK
ncbi:MAG: ATP-dependent helicase [Actinomycetota bacterium]|nr:ATP-dependent helicase [Actinomycetota bacterium]